MPAFRSNPLNESGYSKLFRRYPALFGVPFVLLIVGADDPTSNRGALEVTRKLIPQVQIDLIEGVGHWVMVESKDHITESIPRFLQNAFANGVHTKL